MSNKATLSNNYWIDIEDAAETARLIDQDRLITDYLGGPFPDAFVPPKAGRVLDIACGPGGWALNVACNYPNFEVVGIDLSTTLIQYALAFAHVRELHNITFQVMDVAKPLAFKDASFHFIYTRFLSTCILPETWHSFVHECKRILDNTGILSLNEAEWPLTNSLAFEKLSALASHALWLAGRSFSPDGHHLGITPMLEGFLHDAGYQNIQRQVHALSLLPGTDAYNMCFHNYRILFKLLQPFLQKMGVITAKEFDALYEQMVTDLQSEDFCGLLSLLTVYGEKH
jgi:ubiquinone/menaquinone biosynthesis C-methylase UbiE